MPHQGRHPYEYHDYVLKAMQGIDQVAQGNPDVFKGMYEGVKKEIMNNPDMLYKAYWKNR